MLYCIQVEPFKEQVTEAEIRAIVPEDICLGCFHLTRRMHRKFHGKWRDVTERFLPSYIFIETPDEVGMEQCYFHLKRVPTLTKVVGLTAWEPSMNGLSGFRVLTEQETEFIRRLARGSGAASPGVVDISHVEIAEGDQALILDGPLKGMEGSIKKLDLHRRRAEVLVTLFDREFNLWFGIELVKGMHCSESHRISDRERSSEQRSSEQRSSEQRSSEQRSSEQRSPEQRSPEQRSPEQRSSKQQSPDP